MLRPASVLAARASLGLGFALLAISGCSGPPADSSGAAERPPVAVEVHHVAPGTIRETIDVVGTLAAKFEGEIKAEYSGTIRDVYVTEWVRVEKGTLLARFDTREIEAALEAATASRTQAEVSATRAKRELERMEKLKGVGLATQQNLDDARTALAAATAQVDAARAQEQMARTRLAKADVRSPMDGIVAMRTVNPGDFIQNMGSGPPMFRIVDNRRLDLTVSVPSSRIASVELGQPLTFTADAVPGRTFEGHVSFINPSADEASRTVKVVAQVDNRDEMLRSGLFVKGAIVTNERAGVLSVPRDALVSWNPSTASGMVFVVSGERAQQKFVTTGTISADGVEVAKGLAEGDRVVIRGGFNLRDGDRVTIATSPGA